MASSRPLRSPCPAAPVPFPPRGPARSHSRGRASPAAGQCWPGPGEGALHPRDGPPGSRSGDSGGAAQDRSRLGSGQGSAPGQQRPAWGHGDGPGRCPRGCSPVTAPDAVHTHFVPSAATIVGPILFLVLGVPGGLQPPARAPTASSGFPHELNLPLQTSARMHHQPPCPDSAGPTGRWALPSAASIPRVQLQFTGAVPSIPSRSRLALSQHSCANICTPCHHPAQVGSAPALLPALRVLGCPAPSKGGE